MYILLFSWLNINDLGLDNNWFDEKSNENISIYLIAYITHKIYKMHKIYNPYKPLSIISDEAGAYIRKYDKTK